EDSNVRGPAIYMLGRCGANQQVLPALRSALQDADADVQLQAIMALEHIGPEAADASADLAELLGDPSGQVQLYAERALWRVHPSLALRGGDWKPFTSIEWGFSAIFPAEPRADQMPVPIPNGQTTVHSFQAVHRVTP